MEVEVARLGQSRFARDQVSRSRFTIRLIEVFTEAPRRMNPATRQIDLTFRRNPGRVAEPNLTEVLRNDYFTVKRTSRRAVRLPSATLRLSRYSPGASPASGISSPKAAERSAFQRPASSGPPAFSITWPCVS